MGEPLSRKFYGIEVEAAEAPNISPVSAHGGGRFLQPLHGEQKWLIPGLLPHGVPAILASQGGLGKSFLSLQLCIAMATGKRFLDFPAQAPRGAFYFGLEDPLETVHRRAFSIVEAYRRAGDWTAEDDLAMSRNFAVLQVNWESRQASGYLPDLMPWVTEIMLFAESEHLRPGLIVLDTLARFSQGDENTVQAIRPVLQACSQIAGREWTPLMLHHVAKGQDGARNPKAKDKPVLSDRMSTEWVRGSSAIVDNFRCVLQLVPIREDEAERANLDEEKARERGYLVFGVTKLNGGQKAPWTFLSQTDTGAWAAPADGLDTLATLRGAKARAAVSKQMAVLVDLYHATRMGEAPDLKALAKKHCGESKDPRKALNLHTMKLRAAGFLQKEGHELTMKGVQRVKEAGMEAERTTADGN